MQNVIADFQEKIKKIMEVRCLRTLESLAFSLGISSDMLALACAEAPSGMSSREKKDFEKMQFHMCQYLRGKLHA